MSSGNDSAYVLQSDSGGGVGAHAMPGTNPSSPMNGSFDVVLTPKAVGDADHGLNGSSSLLPRYGGGSGGGGGSRITFEDGSGGGVGDGTPTVGGGAASPGRSTSHATTRSCRSTTTATVTRMFHDTRSPTTDGSRGDDDDDDDDAAVHTPTATAAAAAAAVVDSGEAADDGRRAPPPPPPRADRSDEMWADGVAPDLTGTVGSVNKLSWGGSRPRAAYDHGGNSNDASQVAAWNEELVSTIEKLKRAMIKMEADARAEVVLLNHEVAAIGRENAALRAENDSLKGRVADDVLRQRQTNRVEMAMQKARMMARVRAAGQRRLEYMEGVLMEAHDDVYHVQRWDAMYSPQRDISFVFHFVSGTAYPPRGSEELIFTVYQQILYTTSRQYGGYMAASFRGMEVFAFQEPTTALLFARDCHEQIASLSWPERTETMPYFSTIAEYGHVLFRGPRMHTCIYSCNAEVEVDPVTGRSLFFGPALRGGIEAALELSPVGEIVANDAWAKLFCRAHRLQNDSAEPVRGDVGDVRSALGGSWDVIGMPGTRGIICSILPGVLKGRRGVQPNVLGPTPKYPRLVTTFPGSPTRLGSDGSDPVTVATMATAIVKILKGVAVDMEGNTVDSVAAAAAAAVGQGGSVSLANKRPATHYGSAGDGGNFGAGGGGGGGIGGPARGGGESNAATMLELYSLKQERKDIMGLYRKIEKACAALEHNAMQGEDRFEITRRKLPDPSETAFVCTVDIGDDTTWKRILMSGMPPEEYEVLRNTLRSHVHSAAKHYYGFLMNGNYVDVFTYVFRDVEQALAFVSEVYIQVNRTGTKYALATRGTGKEVFLTRAGVSCGPMSAIYRNLENGVLKCTGPVIRLSGTLCDLANDGEILAMEEVISTFHAKNENLMDTQYNIVRQQGQFLSGFDSPAVVHSILPKPFAYRRIALMSTDRHSRPSSGEPARSAMAVLMVQKQQYLRGNIEGLLGQQLSRLERSEEAQMLSEDTYERGDDALLMGNAAEVVLRNPWVITSRKAASAVFQQQQEAAAAQQQQQALGRNGEINFVARSMLSDEDGGAQDASRAVADVALLYCNVVKLTALRAELETAGARPDLLLEVQRHYNFLVQSVFTQLGGYVAKTNGRCAYLVLFDCPQRALEAGLAIQKRLLNSRWPDELRTALSTLFVRDAATSTVLFNGPRAQVAVHLSNRLTWKRLGGGGGGDGSAASSPDALAGAGGGPSVITVPPTLRVGSGRSSLTPATTVTVTSPLTVGGVPLSLPAGAAVDVSGPAIEEAVILGRHTHGGELRVSNAVLDAVSRKGVPGKLLISQLAMEVVPTPPALRRRSDASSPAAGSGSRGAGGRSRSVADGPGSRRRSSSSNARRRSSVTGRGSRHSVAGGRDGRPRSSSRRSTSPSTDEMGNAKARKASGAAGGHRRSEFTIANAAARRLRRTSGTPLPPKPVKKADSNNVVCVAAVPRSLAARLPLLLKQLSGPAGVAHESGDAATLRAAQPTTEGTDGGAEAAAPAAVAPNKDDTAAPLAAAAVSPTPSAADNGDVDDAASASTTSNVSAATTATTTASEAARSPSAPRTPPSPGASASGSDAAASTSQDNWCLTSGGALQPLPPASRARWAMDARASRFRSKETAALQHMAEQTLKMVSKLTHTASNPPTGVTSPLPSVPGSPTAGGGGGRGGGGGGGASVGRRSQDPSPLSSPRVRVAAAPAVKAAAKTPNSPTTAAAALQAMGASTTTTSSSSTWGSFPGGPERAASYQMFMAFSQDLLAHYVAALRAANEQVKPPPLPKLDAALIAAAAPAPPGRSGAASTNAGHGPALPAIPAARGGVAGSQRGNASHNGIIPPRPPPAVSPGRRAAGLLDGPGDRGGGGQATANRGVAQTAADAAAAAAVSAPAKADPNDPYRAALEYLDEASRLFAVRTGTALGKITPLPTAPQPPASSSFSAQRGGQRRKF